jgi:hypothetical protein
VLAASQRRSNELPVIEWDTERLIADLRPDVFASEAKQTSFGAAKKAGSLRRCRFSQ